jgi:tripartite-type tricarboxylate transporter receptor subunit TctC
MIAIGKCWRALMTLGLGLLIVPPAAAWAQATGAAQYPNQPVRIVVPFSAGSTTDGQARIIADRLAEMWKQQVIVENRPGIAGTASVAKSAADGYTLMLTSNGHTIAKVINRNLPFDPVKDFAGITQVSTIPVGFVVPPDLPAKTIKEFIALAKEKPGKINFASAGRASSSYIAGELFKQTAGIDIVHVPHKGAPEAFTSVLRGDTHLFTTSVSTALDLIVTKKLGILAVTRPIAALPEVPTVADAGLREYAYDSWFGVMAPAGTPPAILNKVSQDIARTLQLAEVNERMTRQGVVIVTQSPAEFDAMIRRDTERYTKILTEAGVEAN